MHHAIPRRAILWTDGEQLRAFFNQSNTAGRACSAEHRKTLPHRPTAAGYHLAPFRIGVDFDDLHLAPIGLQLVGHDAGECGADMLSQLGADNVYSHRTAAIDAIPDGRFE